MIKGDIVLIPFPYTDLTGMKTRPGLVLCSNSGDVTVAFVSSQIKWKDDFDIIVHPAKMNGLKMESFIRLSKIATLSKSLIIGKLG